MSDHLIYNSRVNQPSAKLSVAILLCILSLIASAQITTSREYQVKAAFLYNFTKFVEWPSASFYTAEAPFIIAILGDDPFGSFLDETVAGEKVKGHPIVIQRYKLLKDIEHCHILYINTKEAFTLKEQMAGIQAKTLTVSDGPNFNALGGMIRLLTKDNKIKLVINPSAVKAAELDISSKLLNIAEIFIASR